MTATTTTLGQLKIAAAARPELASYWRQRLAGAGTGQPLPPREWQRASERPLPLTRSPQVHSVAAPPRVVAALDRLTRGNPDALHVAVTTAVVALLRAYTGSDELSVGQPPPAGDEAPLTDLLVLRVPAGPTDTGRELLLRTRGAVLGALAHRDFPLPVLAAELGLPPGAPLVDVAVEVAGVHLPGRTATVPLVFSFAREPAAIGAGVGPDGGSNSGGPGTAAADAPGGLRLDVRYQQERHGAGAAQRLAAHLLLVLAQLVEHPDRELGELTLTTPADLAALAAMNNTAAPFDTGSRLHEVFQRQAAATPEATALVGDGVRWTYAELDRRANRLAHTLRGRGIGPDDLVAVIAERSPQLLVAILAILKAGGAYLPIDPGYPPARTAYVLEDSKAKLVLAQPRFAAALTGDPAAAPAGVAFKYRHSGEWRYLKATHSGTAAVPTGGTAAVPTGGAAVLDLADEASYAGRDDAPQPHGDATNLAYVIYTSGSTGNPKGVQIEHRSVVNRIAWMQKAYPITERDVILQKTPTAFDVSVWELFWWMFTGGSLCLLAPGGEKNPDTIIDAVRAHGVSTLHFVPSMLAVFLDYVRATGAAPALAGLRQVFASGEALGAHTVRQFRALLPHARLVNLYGPTEATVDVSHHPCDTDAEPVPIGRPIDNIRLYVVDGRLRPLPPGVPGELCIAGAGLARGYLHRPELTAQRFVIDPFDGESRVYRTGDLARWLPDGTVEYLGRLDHQVKIRGFRIELGEIEERLRAHPEVTEAVVVAIDPPGLTSAAAAGGSAPPGTSGLSGAADLPSASGTSSEKVLCAYVVPHDAARSQAAPIDGGRQDDPGAGSPADIVSGRRGSATKRHSRHWEPLRAFLAETLPEYMVPAHFVALTEFPLSPNGKLDRRALPAPVVETTGPGYVAPADERAAALAAIWSDVLGVARVGVRDSFFALGGNSIHFVSVLARARELGLEITFQQLFAHPTIAELLAELDAAQPGPGPGAAAADRQEFEAFELIEAADRALLPADAVDAYPLALLQEGLIYQSEITGGTARTAESAQYHDVMSYLIHNRFEPEVFAQAVRLLVAQNPILRTSYHLDGFSEPLQIVHAADPAAPPPLHVVDLRGLDEGRQQAWHEDWVAREQARRFRWAQPGLVRLHVQILREDRYRYSIDLHNSALDGWSINLLHTKLFDLYGRLLAGAAAVAPDGRDHLRNFVGLERRSLRSAADREFWLDVLRGAAPTEVPGKLAPGAAPYAVRMHDVRVSRELSDAVVALAGSLGVPVKNVLLAAHVAVLGSLAGVSDVLTGYEHAGRPELDGAQDALGMFLNTVPLRIQLVDGSWVDLVRAVHAAEVALLPRRRYPMARMKQDAGARAPLFESVFNFTHFYPLRQLREEFSLVDVRAWAETEFVLRAEFSRHFFTDDVCLYLQYHANVFDEARITEVGAHYRAALESMTTAPHAPRPRHAGVPLPKECNPGRPHTAGQASAGRTPCDAGVPAPKDCNVGRPRAGGAGAEAGAGGATRAAVVRRIAAAWSEVLGVPAERIGPADDFFALGGHSLSALRAVVKLGGLVTLTDLTAHPTLGALAAAATGNHRERGLLRRLSANVVRNGGAGSASTSTSHCTSSPGTSNGATSGAGTLVCFPYAAGNAVHFRPLAAELAARTDATVLAVELPGHDPAVDEPFLGVHETARAVVDELAQHNPGPLVLWGHCGGASVAVETARLLLAGGHDLRHLVIGSKLLPTEAQMREALDEVARSTDAEVLAWMVRESGYTELDGLDPANAATIARAFRHDVDGGHRYFLQVCADPCRLDVPVTFVAAADDPLMGDYRRAHQRWSLLTGDLRLRELDAGGHYFVRARAAFAAELVAEIFRSQKG